MKSLYAYLPRPYFGNFQFRLAFIAIAGGILSSLINETLFQNLFVNIISNWTCFAICCSLFNNHKANQKPHFLIISVLIATAFLLGTVLGNIMLLRELVIILMAFFAFYVRRFGPHYVGFPLFMTIIVIITSYIFPHTLNNILINFISALIAAGVSFILWFYVFPFNNLHQKHYNFLVFLKQVNTVFATVKMIVVHPNNAEHFIQLRLNMQKLRRSLRNNLAVLEQQQLLSSQYITADSTVFKQNTLFQLLRMMCDSIVNLYHSTQPLSKQGQHAIHAAILATQHDLQRILARKPLKKKIYALAKLKSYVFGEQVSSQNLAYYSNLTMSLTKLHDFLERWEHDESQ